MELFTGFFLAFLQTISVGKILDGEAKVSTPRGNVWNALILGYSKNTWFCVCKNKSDIVATIMKKHANVFC